MSEVFFPIVVHHNPGCGTSRNTVAMIEAAGYAPTVVEYLKTGWTKPQLQALFAATGARPRDVLREKGTPTPKGVKLCRPFETVLDLLDRRPTSFTKEDGEVVHL